MRYRAQNGNLRKLGWTYRHGTEFVRGHYVCQRETTGMERPEMYSASRCKKHTCAGPQTTPSQGRRYIAQNGTLHKLGWTCRHSTVFTPRLQLYQKEAMSKERPEIYDSRCNNPTYLCGPSNYLVSNDAVWDPERKVAKVGLDFSPWYRVCTKAIFIPK